MKKLEIIKSREQELSILEKYIVQKASSTLPLQILEAGCGRKWPINLEGVDYKITGIDIDKDALNARVVEFGDLDKVINGDLRTIELPENKYDVIYNSFVLEHVDNAQKVLNNFYKWLKPSGILILRIPDRNTVFGFVTRNTPYWFHVYYKKLIYGFKNAGKTGFGPYPTFYDPVVSRTGIHKFCEEKKFIMKEEYGQDRYLKKGGRIVSSIIKPAVHFLGFLSFSKLAWKHNNLIYILEKKG